MSELTLRQRLDLHKRAVVRANDERAAGVVTEDKHRPLALRALRLAPVQLAHRECDLTRASLGDGDNPRLRVLRELGPIDLLDDAADAFEILA